jgi:eukaryotic-like serine/threonine-protein kinase
LEGGTVTAANAVVGPWTTGARLGAGRTARVYAARHTWTGAEAAIKLYRGARTRSVEDGARFLQEARTLDALDHPFVPRLIDSGIGARWRLFIAMRRCQGRDLRTLLGEIARRGFTQRRRIQRSLLLPAFVRTCHAVQHAHDEGFVHGDIKPANVVVDGHVEGGLIDWGMSTEQGRGGRTSSRRGSVSGTPGYIAPERVREPGGPSDPAEDIYALGALLYELITLRPANPGETPEARLRAAFRRPSSPAPRESDDHLPGSLETLASRAMSLHRADRPESAGLLAAATEELLQDCVEWTHSGREVGHR